MEKDIVILSLCTEDTEALGYNLTEDQFEEVAERLAESFDDSFQYALKQAIRDTLGE